MDCVLNTYDRCKRQRRNWEYIKNYYFKCGRILTYEIPVSIPRMSQISVSFRGNAKTGWQLKYYRDLRRSPSVFLEKGGDAVFDIDISGRKISVSVSETKVTLVHDGCEHLSGADFIDVNEWAAAIFHPRKGCIHRKNPS